MKLSDDLYSDYNFKSPLALTIEIHNLFKIYIFLL